MVQFLEVRSDFLVPNMGVTRISLLVSFKRMITQKIFPPLFTFAQEQHQSFLDIVSFSTFEIFSNVSNYPILPPT